jgi:hypothetical protein
LKIQFRAALFATSLCLLQGCIHTHTAQAGITHDEALRMARRAAVKKGYVLRDYSLLSYKPTNDLSQDGQEWFFLFTCKRLAPGCAFSVSINRKSGATEVSPGM